MTRYHFSHNQIVPNCFGAVISPFEEQSAIEKNGIGNILKSTLRGNLTFLGRGNDRITSKSDPYSDHHAFTSSNSLLSRPCSRSLFFRGFLTHHALDDTERIESYGGGTRRYGGSGGMNGGSRVARSPLASI